MSKKKEKLTKKELALIPKVRDEWINHYLNSGYETNYETLRPLIDWVYQKAGLSKPFIFIADGYVSQKFMINYVIEFLSNILSYLLIKDQVGNQVRNQVRNQVENQVGGQVESQVRNQVRNQVESQVRNQVRSQVWDQVGNQVRNQVGNQVWDQVWNQVESQVGNQVKNQVGNQVESQVGNQVGNQVKNQVRSQVWSQVGNQVESQVGNQVESQVWNQVKNQVGNQVWDQVRSQVESQVGNQVKSQVKSQVWDQVESQVRNQVENQVWDQVESQVRNQVWDQVESQVRNQVRSQVRSQVENQVKIQFYEHWSGCWDAGWIAYYNMFEKMKIVNNSDFTKYKELQKQGFSIVYFKYFVVVCKMPKNTLRDDKNKLHSVTGPAIEWRDGLNTNYFIHGVRFDDKEFYDRVIKRKLTVKEILAIPNTDQRFVVMQYYGMENILDNIDKKLIDKSSYGNELYSFQLDAGLEVKVLVYPDIDDPKKKRVSFPHPSLNTASDAMAWQHNSSEEEYAQMEILKSWK